MSDQAVICDINGINLVEKHHLDLVENLYRVNLKNIYILIIYHHDIYDI